MHPAPVYPPAEDPSYFNLHSLPLVGYSSSIERLSSVGARSHGASVAATGSMIMGVADTCHTKWVQDPLTKTVSANIHCRS